MAYRNQVIHDHRSGWEITFLHPAHTTNGLFLGMVIKFQSQAHPPDFYYHPHQSIDFDVLNGELIVLLNGTSERLQPGDSLHIPANQDYALWNSSAQPTLINCRLRPALNAEYLLEAHATLVKQELGAENRLSYLLRSIVLARQFSNVYRRSKVPFVLQKIVFILLTPVAYLKAHPA